MKVVVASTLKKKSSNQTTILKNPSLSLVIFMLVILAGSIIFTVVWVDSILKDTSGQPLEVKLLPYTFKVTSDYGFVLDTDALHFGEGPPGTTLSKKINLTAEDNVRVEILWDGPGEVRASDIDFTMVAGDIKSIQFFLTIPDNASLGDYSGLIYFNFYDFVE